MLGAEKCAIPPAGLDGGERGLYGRSLNGMTPNEIMAALGPRQACELIDGLRERNRPACRTAAGLLATRKKLRPAFLDKKPLPERHAWMAAEMTRKSNADIASEVLQNWLFACHQSMLRDFLDRLNIPHDGEGLIESLPPQPAPGALRDAVDFLVDAHPAWAVMVYLNLFCAMDIATWPDLEEIVATHPALTQPNPVP
jgi:hypothetical protein